jgi:RNA polymerase sigma-70 factor (ECF subfamily)
MNHSDDSELVKALRRGDVEAFDIIYSRYARKLYSFTYKYLRSADDAAELVQTVFIKLWENHGKLDGDLSFRSYLFTIAYNDICRVFRSRKYAQVFINEELYKNYITSSDTEEVIDYRSVLERINILLDKLPEKQQLVFRKRRFIGMSAKDVAAELGISPGTVDNYVSETVAFLRKCINIEDLSMVLFLALFLSDFVPGIS